MKTLGKLKLNDWAESQLSNSELRNLKGGADSHTCISHCGGGTEADRQSTLQSDSEMGGTIQIITIPPTPIPTNPIDIDIITKAEWSW